MSEVGEFIRGRRFTKEDIVPDGIPSIHYGEIYTRYGVFAAEALSHVRPELEPAYDSPRREMSSSPASARPSRTSVRLSRGSARRMLRSMTTASSSGTRSIRSSSRTTSRLTPSTRELAKHVSRAKLKRISAASLGTLKIPVPPREEQERIVAILDKFDALVNDLSIGLPAEISARRQQYEYYRDKLLTFEELAA